MVSPCTEFDNVGSYTWSISNNINFIHYQPFAFNWVEDFSYKTGFRSEFRFRLTTFCIPWADYIINQQIDVVEYNIICVHKDQHVEIGIREILMNISFRCLEWEQICSYSIIFVIFHVLSRYDFSCKRTCTVKRLSKIRNQLVWYFAIFYGIIANLRS